MQKGDPRLPSLAVFPTTTNRLHQAGPWIPYPQHLVSPGESCPRLHLLLQMFRDVPYMSSFYPLHSPSTEICSLSSSTDTLMRGVTDPPPPPPPYLPLESPSSACLPDSAHWASPVSSVTVNSTPQRIPTVCSVVSRAPSRRQTMVDPSRAGGS